MIRDIHLAAQYLAAAGISFLEKENDDSHTTMGFDIENNRFFTHPLNTSGDALGLQMGDFALEWITGDSTDKLHLDKTTHRDILNWIDEVKSHSGGIRAPYQYRLHYTLPYSIHMEYSFKKEPASLKNDAALRVMATEAIEKALIKSEMVSPIRTWPHHFDTGAYAQILGKDLAIGLGLAIPDDLINDYYFYTSGYRGHQAVVPDNPIELSAGQWRNENFTGAILKASEINTLQAQTFFEQAIASYNS